MGTSLRGHSTWVYDYQRYLVIWPSAVPLRSLSLNAIVTVLAMARAREGDGDRWIAGGAQVRHSYAPLQL